MVDGVAHPLDEVTTHTSLAPRGSRNTVYIARENLALNGVDLDLPGAGVFDRYDDRLRLTKEGGNRSTWELPSWFAPGESRPPRLPQRPWTLAG